VLVPDEAPSFELAFQLADDRLYSNKGTRGRDAGGQVRDIVLSLVNEVQPSLRHDAARAAMLARTVGASMGIEGKELEDLVRCSELQDIGKTALPAAILDKAGPLTADEWTLVRQHTTIAERVLLAAPSLAGVAALARSSYEHFDGSGYPDALAGEQIPLGSRITYVCRAFDAMLSERPFQAAVDEAESLRRLRAGAGTQFDPAVVELFAAAIESAGGSASQAA
jgi:response regulator RpfG family c-di-GMP phosphodiesterase